MARLGLMLAMAAITAVTPAPAASTTTDILAEHELVIARSAEGQFSGAGWNRLLAEARGAQFTMIGEQHPTADLAQFETAMFRAIAPFGYTHAALEVGPHSADYAEAMIRSKPGALARYIAAPGHSFYLPFLFFAGETEMVEVVVATSPDRKHALWGLDQEFVGSVPILAELLRRHATTDGQRTAAAALAARTTSNPMLLPALSEADLDALTAAFRGNRAATEIVDAIRLSHAIYQPFVTGKGSGQAANLKRETYMKDNFLRLFTAAEKRLGAPPKVFLKFGGYHAMRGMSGTDVPALGNFLAEWGHSRGFGLLNIMADCASGEMVDPRSGKASPCEPYIGRDSALYKLAAGRNDGITLIDLKTLRTRLGAMKDIDARSRQTILAFDYYISFKNVRGATPLGTMPPS